MNEKIKALMGYLDASPSAYHAVAGLEKALQAAGYAPLREQDTWTLAPGGKYYLTRGGSSLLAFRIPRETPGGFALGAAHTDRPCLKLKENGELTSAYTRLSVERYGGMLLAPWLDRPLSVAGRVLVETPTGVKARLVDLVSPVALIPNVAIHMNRTANDGQKWDMTRDLLPLLGGAEAAGRLRERLEEAAGGALLGADLNLYPCQKAQCWGVDGEYLSASALDDLACLWACCQGFLQARDCGSIPVLCAFDSEEVGSSTRQGADSDLLAGTLARIAGALDLPLGQLLAGSMLVSADNAHGLHPNRPELSDPKNAPVLGGGLALKFTANQKYTTDGLTAAVFRRVCALAGVKTQTYCNRADVAGGSTLGCISVNHVSVPGVDIGLPQLAMHSCYETCAMSDFLDLEKAMAAWFGTRLRFAGDGEVTLGS